MKISKILYVLTAVIFVVSLLVPVMAASDTQQTTLTETQMEVGEDYGTLVSVDELKGYYKIETYIENDPETLKLLIKNGIMVIPEGASPTEFSVRRVIDLSAPSDSNNAQSRGMIYTLKDIVYTGRTTDTKSFREYIGGPGGTLSAPPSETLKNSWSGRVSASTISAGIGSNVKEAKSIRSNSSLTLKENERGSIAIHVRYDNYKFDIYNTWFGRLIPMKLGSGTAKVVAGLDYRYSKWTV